MAVRIRLQRHGRKKRPFYRLVAADARFQRDGRFLERLGHYNPLTDPAEVVIDEEKALKWLKRGAQPSDTAKNLLSQTGIWERFIAEKLGQPIPPPREVEPSSEPEVAPVGDADDSAETEAEPEEAAPEAPDDDAGKSPKKKTTRKKAALSEAVDDSAETETEPAEATSEAPVEESDESSN